ncbi:hypothetical protein [Streptomyces sp. NPDC005438]|uniref:hypothetical protein n=1 Tax=Streptomyces sp. NPDC005438 TaxID=3156880 RepID=UPI0033A7B8E3
MTGFKTDTDGRIVAAPEQTGPLSNITDDEMYDLIDTEWSYELANSAGDREVLMAPEPGDHTGKQYRTVGGNLVTTARTAETEVSYWYCAGCGKRDELGYGWSDVARDRAEQHAAKCRAV